MSPFSESRVISPPLIPQFSVGYVLHIPYFPSAYRPFLLTEGLCLSTSFSTSFAFSNEANLSSGS